MARFARVVVPGLPHHVTQRGNRRQRTFFQNSDYRLYLNLLAEWCPKFQVDVWAYCLMPNHVHLILVPQLKEGLCLALTEVHRRYSLFINSREGWRGYLWQGRFASFPMDNRHLLAAARYVELNPVKAGLVRNAEDYSWSSAAAHFEGGDDGVVKAGPILGMIPNWQDFLREPAAAIEIESFQHHGRTGRPMGDEQFVIGLERSLRRSLRKGKPGRRSRQGELSNVSPD